MKKLSHCLLLSALLLASSSGTAKVFSVCEGDCVPLEHKSKSKNSSHYQGLCYRLYADILDLKDRLNKDDSSFDEIEETFEIFKSYVFFTRILQIAESFSYSDLTEREKFDHFIKFNDLLKSTHICEMKDEKYENLIFVFKVLYEELLFTQEWEAYGIPKESDFLTSFSYLNKEEERKVSYELLAISNQLAFSHSLDMHAREEEMEKEYKVQALKDAQERKRLAEEKKRKEEEKKQEEIRKKREEKKIKREEEEIKRRIEEQLKIQMELQSVINGN